MKLVQRSICPRCGESTLALVTFDSSAVRDRARCQACGHSWSLRSPQPAIEHSPHSTIDAV